METEQSDRKYLFPYLFQHNLDSSIKQAFLYKNFCVVLLTKGSSYLTSFFLL